MDNASFHSKLLAHSLANKYTNECKINTCVRKYSSLLDFMSGVVSVYRLTSKVVILLRVGH